MLWCGSCGEGLSTSALMDVNLIADQSQSEEFIKIMKLNVHYNLLKSLYLNKGIIREVTMYLNKGIIRKVLCF